MLINEQECFDFMQESRQALQKIKNYNQHVVKNPLKVLSENLQKATVGQEFFEAYDALAWEGKVRVDMLYFDQLLQKLDNNVIQEMQNALGKYFKNIRQIYEHVNIKPEIYGKGVSIDILELSNDQCRQKLSTVIYEYLDKNFYTLTPEMRKNKYEDECRELAKNLIAEGNDPEASIEFSIKTAVMENLLTKIAFPFAAWSRIKFLEESEDYGKVFDQNLLIELVDSFEKNVHSLAKVIAAII